MERNQRRKTIVTVVVTLASITAWGAWSSYKLYHTDFSVPPDLALPAPEPTPEPKIELLPELVPICACESTGDRNGTPTHYDANGNVLRGRVNPDDVGMCQINLYHHQKTAESLGLDLFKEQDNIIYANVLYTEQGPKPWEWSRDCWNQ